MHLFKGRLSRTDFWVGILVLTVVFAAIGFLLQILGVSNSGGVAMIVTGVIYAILALSMEVRRLHDIGKSGWNVLWGLIPLVGGLYLLYLMCNKGEVVVNKYGEPQPNKGVLFAIL